MFFLPWFDKVGFDTGLSVTPLTHESSEVLGKLLLLECPCPVITWY